MLHRQHVCQVTHSAQHVCQVRACVGGGEGGGQGYMCSHGVTQNVCVLRVRVLRVCVRVLHVCVCLSLCVCV
jgi:hypothetical protein